MALSRSLPCHPQRSRYGKARNSRKDNQGESRLRLRIPAINPRNKLYRVALASRQLGTGFCCTAQLACSASKLADPSSLKVHGLEDVDPVEVAPFRSDWFTGGYQYGPLRESSEREQAARQS